MKKKTNPLKHFNDVQEKRIDQMRKGGSYIPSKPVDGGVAVTGVINDYRGRAGAGKPTAGPSPAMRKGGSAKKKK